MNLEKLRSVCSIYPRHLCCDRARFYLFPPSAGTGEGPDGFVKIDGGRVKLNPIAYWHIDLGDGGSLIPVEHCPFCGADLPGPRPPDSFI